MVYIGVDLGGTGIKAGVVDESGKILAKVSCPTGVERGYGPVICDMAALCKKAVEEAHLTMDDVHSIGIGIPGICDPKTNRVPFCTNLGWHDVPLIEEMHKYIDKPVHVDNDATVAGLAESVAGVSAGVKNSVFVTLGTGVGGGIILDGAIAHGSSSMGEIGHIIIEAENGLPCPCGQRGCWEQYASVSALIKRANEAADANPDSILAKIRDEKGGKLDGEAVFDAYGRRCPIAGRVLEKYTDYLAVGITSLINVFGPDAVILAGGITSRCDVLVPMLIRKIPNTDVNIEISTLKNDAGSLGAALL